MDTRKRRLCLRVAVSLGLIIGVVLTALGLYLRLTFDSLIKQKTKEALAIRKCSEAGERFENPLLPTLVYVTVFNVTNPDEVNEGLAKPNLKEIGPFVYRLTKRKLVLRWDTNAGTITYRERPTFHFLKSKSIGDPKDFKIYHINAPDAAIAEHIAPMRLSLFTASRFLSMTFGLNFGPLVIEHTASQLLFEGYRVDTLDFLQEKVGKYVTVPDRLPNNTFGLFYGKNHTYGKEITVLSGVDDISNLGRVVEFNHTRTLPYWRYNSTCNEIIGTDGTFFAPFIKKSQSVYAFSPELCRSLRLSYQETLEVKGIEVYRYAVPKTDYLAKEENRCYCLAEDVKQCQGSGVLSIRTCLDGSPVALSAPHFYQAESTYVNDFTGLNQTDERHASYADIDPITGVVMRGTRKLQINFEISKQETIPFLADVNIRFFPFAYLNEVGEVNEALASEFLWRVAYPVKYGIVVVSVILAIGVTSLIVTLASIFIVKKRSRNSKEPMKNGTTAINGNVTTNDKQQKTELKDLQPLKPVC